MDAAVAADAGDRARRDLENPAGFPQRPPRFFGYAIAARISCAVLDSAGVLGCCIDSALK